MTEDKALKLRLLRDRLDRELNNPVKDYTYIRILRQQIAGLEGQ